MDATQQQMFDSYRAARRGEAAPPAPGTYEMETVRQIRLWREFLAVLDGRVKRVKRRRRGRAARRPADAAVPRVQAGCRGSVGC
ncbi:hypothetical protein J7W19_18090 [Streptomyces mobaraensis NBRC 13819 = DSM 40847]|uniref:Uncharacterized protein n=1 Tax=Streptomyces mobaraensis (strain ATCC 29032 / DSM 40847 / JCM 4168 / NBRC 13819 / NCIMB 11159 / IPCR 16-22) TaxID=1223523 RepID=M3CCD8_STRM1|nr:hypothetical protein [Streptomyces mobaraensis]EMF01661.1 hypothetical protein H340_05619 [Streptomyces mobaraensis NBRC 13819 = DSM 40847]QTT75036.1 hypothetical protein J7W19_18090 [Streptomyces mobaraensis NBRC 13819 = DSM 40847]